MSDSNTFYIDVICQEGSPYRDDRYKVISTDWENAMYWLYKYVRKSGIDFVHVDRFRIHHCNVADKVFKTTTVTREDYCQPSVELHNHPIVKLNGDVIPHQSVSPR